MEGTGRACAVGRAVWDQAPAHVEGLAGNLQPPWLTGSSVSHPAYHVGMPPAPYWVEGDRSNHVLNLQCANRSSRIISICDHPCTYPMRHAILPILQMEKQAHQSSTTCLVQREDSTQTCLTGKPGFLPHKPHRLLPGGFRESGIGQPTTPLSQLVQGEGCGWDPSPLSTTSSALASPLACSVLGRCPAWLLCHVARHQALGPQARPGLPWQCPTPGLPREPKSHWNVSEIPPFRPASKLPLPDGHSHYEQQENLFRSRPDFQFGKQMATIVRLPYALYFPLPFHSVFSFSQRPIACGGYKARQSLSSDFSSSTSQPFDLGLILGA